MSQQESPQTNRPKLYRMADVLEITGLCRATIYNLMDKDDFPKSIKLGQRAIAWKADEVHQWIDSRVCA
ncbi:hypothetical protein JCM19235_1932 [Vibrio maritimus]|uniref:Transcriptional regulator n=1 Tax=Vibrio maritimus TaxID=990268 RepID=A0A090RWE5_9VIBR|nr:hypothetical protein JCM19235_1932 [Vibrio maritimus]